MTTIRPSRWPLILRLLHLPLPIPILAFGVLRVVVGPPPSTLVVVAVGVATVWTLVVLVAVAVPRSRHALITHRYQLALCFGTGLLTLAACDVTLTAFGIVPTIAARREASLEYAPTAFTRHRLRSKDLALPGNETITINRRGYLGEEILLPKPADTKRLVFLGGSQVFGAFWSAGKDWPTECGKYLNASGHRVDVVNAGIPNHQSGDAIGKLFADLWMVEPDMVVCCNSWNDIKYFAELSLDRPYLHVAAPTVAVDRRLYPNGLDRVLCLSAFYRKVHSGVITSLYGVAGDEGLKFRDPVMNINEISLRQYELNLQTVCDIGKNLGATVVLCKQARLLTADANDEQRQRIPYSYTGLGHDELVRAFEACDALIEKVAAEKHCQVLDMNSPLSGKTELFTDHIHFSVEGTRQAAQLVAAALAKNLADPPVSSVTQRPEPAEGVVSSE